MPAETSTPASSLPPAGAPFTWNGATVIITGASSGLGAEFARQLGGRVAGLVLAARSADALQQISAELTTAHPSLKIVVAVADLSKDEGRAALWETIARSGVKPNVLVNNAGLGDYGVFTSASQEKIRQQIEVNITALTELTHTFLQQRAGSSLRCAVLNISSLASTVPLPDLAVYAATKAYVTSFSEAIAIELSAEGIPVLAVCPGPTPTQFGTNARRQADRDIDREGEGLLRIPPERVVSEGIAALEAGTTIIFPGKRVAFAAFVFRLLPRWMVRLIARARFKRSLQKPAP